MLFRALILNILELHKKIFCSWRTRSERHLEAAMCSPSVSWNVKGTHQARLASALCLDWASFGISLFFHQWSKHCCFCTLIEEFPLFYILEYFTLMSVRFPHQSLRYLPILINGFNVSKIVTYPEQLENHLSQNKLQTEHDLCAYHLMQMCCFLLCFHLCIIWQEQVLVWYLAGTNYCPCIVGWFPICMYVWKGINWK